MSMNIFHFFEKNLKYIYKGDVRMANFSPYTDLAIEIAENITTKATEIDGVEIAKESCDISDTVVTMVKVTNSKGAEVMGKPIGNYVTLESNLIKENDKEIHEEIIKILSKYIKFLCPFNENSTILVVGLGNSHITPDSLGPKVIDRILVTRHIRDTVPEDIAGSVSSVAAIAPGVMGITGIETVEIVKGITERIKPDIVIAIDALAARKVSRVNSTIQLSDTGVAPGAGVGNKRKTLDEESLGVPVIAIGVPTVVDAATLANDTLERMIEAMMAEADERSEFYGMLEKMAEDEKYQLICEVLNPYAENMFVTPKEVDAVIENLVNIIANGINIALHPGIDNGDINRYK